MIIPYSTISDDTLSYQSLSFSNKLNSGINILRCGVIVNKLVFLDQLINELDPRLVLHNFDCATFKLSLLNRYIQMNF